jgi:hypothetical protein
MPAAFKKVLWDGAGDREFTFKWAGKRSSYEWKRSWDGDPAVARAQVPRDRVREPPRGARKLMSCTVPDVPRARV